MTQQFHTQTIDQLVVFTVNVSQWSGRRRLKSDDIRGNPELPPADLASLGSLKVANPEDLAVFERLKKKAIRSLAGAGIRFLNGYAIPESLAEAKANELIAIGKEFADQRDLLRASFPSKMGDWIKAHPSWETEIRRAVLDADDATNRFAFTWNAFKIQASQKSAALATNVVEAASGLAGQLYAEVASVANDVIEKSILGRDKANGRILLPLKTLRAKLAGLAFIDPIVNPLVDTIDHVVEKTPKGAPIEGDALATIYGLMLILSDPQRIKAHGNAVINGAPVAALIDDAKPGAQSDKGDGARAEKTAEAPVQAVATQIDNSAPAGSGTVDSIITVIPEQPESAQRDLLPPVTPPVVQQPAVQQEAAPVWF